MNKIIEEELIQGLHVLIGLNKKRLREYVKSNDIGHILDHPAVLGMNERQIKKLYQLKDFINAYCVLRAEPKKEVIRYTEDARRLFLARLGYHCEYENLMAAFLDCKGKVISFEAISEESIYGTLMLPQKIAKRAILLDAKSVIIGHNHPSLEVVPSKEDIRTTKSLILGLRLLDVELLDHIIVGGNQALSMREEHIIDFENELDVDKYLELQKGKQGYAAEERGIQLQM